MTTNVEQHCAQLHITATAPVIAFAGVAARERARMSAAAERPTDERPTDERPTDERPTDERPTDERARASGPRTSGMDPISPGGTA